MRRLFKSLVFRSVVLGCAACAAFIAAIVLYFGSPSVAFAYFSGEPFIVAPSVVDLGTCRPAQQCETSVDLVNLTDHSIRLVGSTTDCNCVVAKQEMPAEIAPRERHEVLLQVALPNSLDKAFSRRLVLFVADKEIGSVPVEIRAHN